MIGGEGILEELQLAGFTGLGGPVSLFCFVCLDCLFVCFWLQEGTSINRFKIFVPSFSMQCSVNV